jgi:hypothetical protein
MRVRDGLGLEQVFGMWWVKRNACGVWAVNWSEEKLGGLNTNMGCKDIGCDLVHWINLAVDRDK